MPTMQISRTLLPLITEKKRFTVIYGGRGGGKSVAIADILLQKCVTEQAKIAVLREFHNTISDSVYALLLEEIDRLELDGFLPPQRTKIEHRDGGIFRFRGLAKDPAGLKSMTGFKYFFIEEAGQISEAALRILSPTLRKFEDSVIYLVANPGSSADPFSKRFLTPFQKELDHHGIYQDDLHLIIRCNYDKNPWFPQVLNSDRLWDQKNRSSAYYQHVWEGAYSDEVENSIIPVDWFDSAIDSHKKLGFKATGAIIASYDPAGLGSDASGLFVRQGSVVLDVAFYDKAGSDVNANTDWALDRAMKFQPDLFTWDVGGLGAGLTRQIHQAFVGKKCEIIQFDGAGAVENPESPYQDAQSSIGRQRTNRQSLQNKRAQYYSRLMLRFYNTWLAVVKRQYIDPDTMISIPAELENLAAFRAEVCRVPRKINPNGLFQIMSKQDMARQKPPIPSPNMADSAMMSMLIPSVLQEEDDNWQDTGDEWSP